MALTRICDVELTRTLRVASSASTELCALRTFFKCACAAAQAHLKKVRSAQSSVLAELATRKVRVSSTSQILVNAIFVRVAPQDTAALKNIPGVKWIQYLPPSKPLLNAAVNLVGVPAAWSAIGGSANAGAGVRIGIIDTGIDQNHPGFKDTGFTLPAGFPAGDPGFAAYTNNKVIVARSYVSMLTDQIGRASC